MVSLVSSKHQQFWCWVHNVDKTFVCTHFELFARRFTAVGNHLEMDFMEGYFGQQVVPDCYHDPKKWWEVMDRTTGQAVPASRWELTGASMPEGFGDGSEFKGAPPHLSF